MVMMTDLVGMLRGWAKKDIAMSEFGLDNHIAGVAAQEIERLRAALEVNKLVIDRLMRTQREDAFTPLGELIQQWKDEGLLDDKALNPDVIS